MVFVPLVKVSGARFQVLPFVVQASGLPTRTWQAGKPALRMTHTVKLI